MTIKETASIELRLIYKTFAKKMTRKLINFDEKDKYG